MKFPREMASGTRVIQKGISDPLPQTYAVEPVRFKEG